MSSKRKGDNAKGGGFCQKFFEDSRKRILVMSWYKGGESFRQIEEHLWDVFGVTISHRTIGRFLSSWGVKLRPRGGANNVKGRG